MSPDPKVNPANVMVDNQNKVIEGHDVPGAPDKVFALQTDAWGSLQRYIIQTLTLPVLDATTFQDKYGAFKDEAIVEQAIPILQHLQTAALAFGDIITDSVDLSKFIGTDTPPPHPYGHAIWLASKIESTAMQVSNMAKSAIPALEKETDPAKRAEDIKQLLTYPDYGMYTHAEDLNTKSLAFKDALGKYISDTFRPAKTEFETYFNKTEQNVLADAHAAISADVKKVNSLTDRVESLNKSLLGWAIGGSIATVILMPIGPLGLAMGTAEIIEIIKIKNEIDDLNNQIDDLNDDKKKKAKLVADLNTLIAKSQSVDDSADDFQASVASMATGFGQCAQDLQKISTTVTPATVEALPPFLQNTGLETAEADWGDIKIASNTFISTGQYVYKPA